MSSNNSAAAQVCTVLVIDKIVRKLAHCPQQTTITV